jgi:hypothetical protein
MRTSYVQHIFHCFVTPILLGNLWIVFLSFCSGSADSGWYVPQIGAEFQLWIQYHTRTYNTIVGASIEPSMNSPSHWRYFC